MVDGNKRLGTHVMLVFLALNGYELSYTQKELSHTILDLAFGNIDAEDRLRWIIGHQKYFFYIITCNKTPSIL